MTVKVNISIPETEQMYVKYRVVDTANPSYPYILLKPGDNVEVYLHQNNRLEVIEPRTDSA